ncbi:hypothetical protein F2P79_008643 [Pimephales promelas]|nr:hypothetical protein F2P79_008643 [Pimephales promelas]
MDMVRKMLRLAVAFKLCPIGTKGPKVCREENIPHTITPPLPACTVITAGSKNCDFSIGDPLSPTYHQSITSNEKLPRHYCSKRSPVEDLDSSSFEKCNRQKCGKQPSLPPLLLPWYFAEKQPEWWEANQRDGEQLVALDQIKKASLLMLH